MLKISHAWGFRVDIPTGKFPLWVGNNLSIAIVVCSEWEVFRYHSSIFLDVTWPDPIKTIAPVHLPGRASAPFSSKTVSQASIRLMYRCPALGHQQY
jgi:hypothetical protein